MIGFGHTEPAMYQGARLHLRVSRFAAADLAYVLSAAADDERRPPQVWEIPLLLPDERKLWVVVQLTDAGYLRDEDGKVLDYDGRPHADVSGDFTLHVAARKVIDSASAPYHDRLTAERAAEVDERRIRWKLDQHLPAIGGDERLQALRDDVYRRATAIADATRDERLAAAGTDPAARRDGWGWSP